MQHRRCCHRNAKRDDAPSDHRELDVSPRISERHAFFTVALYHRCVQVQVIGDNRCANDAEHNKPSVFGQRWDKQAPQNSPDTGL